MKKRHLSIEKTDSNPIMKVLGEVELIDILENSPMNIWIKHGKRWNYKEKN